MLGKTAGALVRAFGSRHVRQLAVLRQIRAGRVNFTRL